MLSSLSILNKLTWIDATKLEAFILSAQVSSSTPLINIHLICVTQDVENGGIADRPGDMVDVFHTIFGVAGSYRPVSSFPSTQHLVLIRIIVTRLSGP